MIFIGFESFHMPQSGPTRHATASFCPIWHWAAPRPLRRFSVPLLLTPRHRGGPSPPWRRCHEHGRSGLAPCSGRRAHRLRRRHGPGHLHPRPGFLEAPRGRRGTPGYRVLLPAEPKHRSNHREFASHLGSVRAGRDGEPCRIPLTVKFRSSPPPCGGINDSLRRRRVPAHRTTDRSAA